MKVLVTGGLGHIGSLLIKRLGERQDIDEVIILDDLSNQRYCSLMGLPEKMKYTFIQGDIRDLETVRRAVKGVDIVIHLAAITNAPETLKHPKLTKEINYDAVKTLLEISKEEDVKKFFFPSTTSVYGPAEGKIDENYDDYKPLTPYAKYKLEAEKEVIKANDGMKTCVARFGTIYGYSIGMRFHTAVNKFTFQALNKKPLTVWTNAINQKRPYLDLKDGIRFIEFFIENNEENFFGQVYNVLTENATVQDVVDVLKSYISNLEIKTTESPIINQASYEVSRDKVEKTGFKFEGNMKSGIGETIENFRSLNKD